MLTEMARAENSIGLGSSTAGDHAVVALPGWFPARDEHLFAWLHQPPTDGVRGAVLLCPPFFTEEQHAHRAYLELADMSARSGFAALRFDYTGTGDSSGSPESVVDVAVWAEDVVAAVRLLRSSGAQWVGAVALRAAANLLATIQGSECDAVVLWDPIRDGRSYVRELALLQRAVGDLDGMTPEPTIAGFRFGEAFRSSIAALPPVEPSSRARTLLLERGQRGVSESGIEVHRIEGQSELLEVKLHLAEVPRPTLRRIVDWCSAQAPTHRTRQLLPLLSDEWPPDGGSGMERVRWLPRAAGPPLFAIGAEPAGDHEQSGADLTCVFFNSGAQSHVGP
ncbi:MAG: alpha/beta hydrolase family protein, partial [Acidimicrobiales bacterium]